LQAAKEYVVYLMKKGTIRPSKSPYGALLFFVKDGDKLLQGVVDYRSLNRITREKTNLYQDLMRCLIDLKKQ
jgi:hypothetical protein